MNASTTHHPRMIQYLLGGWWETCSATKLTLLAEHSGTGPSDTVSWKKHIEYGLQITIMYVVCVKG